MKTIAKIVHVEEVAKTKGVVVEGKWGACKSAVRGVVLGGKAKRLATVEVVNEVVEKVKKLIRLRKTEDFILNYLYDLGREDYSEIYSRAVNEVTQSYF